MSPLGLMPPGARQKLAKQADQRIANHQVHAVEVWPDAPLEQTLIGLIHGIIGRDPWVIQCDGCGHTETHTVLMLCRIRFHMNTETDSRRLCPECQEKARWAS